MRGIGGAARRHFVFVAAALLLLTACGRQAARLPAVAPLPPPKVPVWVEQISPTGQADNYAQIRVRFKQPLIPVEAIETPDQQGKLAYFSVTPALAGHFRFLTPRMVGFQADRALPIATRIQVVVRAGLTDLENHTLDHDVAWTFTHAADPVGQPAGHQGRLRAVRTRADVPDRRQHASSTRGRSNASAPWCRAGGARVPVRSNSRSSRPRIRIARPTTRSTRPPRAGSTTSRPAIRSTRARQYSLVFGPGIQPAHGNLQAPPR